MDGRMTKPVNGDRHETGQTLVEFALIAPILFTLLFGIIQFGFLFSGQTGLVNALRDTTRYAATYRVSDAPSVAAACSNVSTQLTNNLKAQLPGFASSRLHPTVTYTWVKNPDNTSYYVRATVSATYDHPLFVPLVGNIIDGLDGKTDNSFTIGGSEQMRIENPSLTASGG